MQYVPATGLSNPPSICLERCREIPVLEATNGAESTGERTWMLEMLEQYTECSVLQRVCSSELLNRKLEGN